MEQFVVPQFLDIEDKIIGPISVRQFVILVVAGVIVFITYKLADFSLFVLLSALIIIVAVAFAFIKINGQQFHYFLLNLGQTWRRPTLRIWNKTVELSTLRRLMEEEKSVIPSAPVRKEPVTFTKLAELSLIVNTGGVYKGEE